MVTSYLDASRVYLSEWVDSAWLNECEREIHKKKFRKLLIANLYSIARKTAAAGAAPKKVVAKKAGSKKIGKKVAKKAAPKKAAKKAAKKVTKKAAAPKKWEIDL